MNHVRIIAAAVLLLFSASACSSQSMEGKQAPAFNLKTAAGKTVDLKNLAGKVVVVNFWATWCPPCRAEIPGMEEVYEKYKDKGLEIVGISLDRDGWNAVKPFLQKTRMTYPVVLDDADAAAAYGGISAIPTSFVVDRKGRIVKHHVGYFPKQDFEAAVKPLL